MESPCFHWCTYAIVFSLLRGYLFIHLPEQRKLLHNYLCGSTYHAWALSIHVSITDGKHRFFFFLPHVLTNYVLTDTTGVTLNSCYQRQVFRRDKCCVQDWYQNQAFLVSVLSSRSHTQQMKPYLYAWSCKYNYRSCTPLIHSSTYTPGGPPPQKKKTEQSIQSIFQDFALINSYLFSPCWIEHLFLIIITPRSSNLVENVLFYE